jgi:hypothetical protein
MFIATVNLVILAYFHLCGDDTLKARSALALVAVNAYALGAILYNLIPNPIRNKL